MIIPIRSPRVTILPFANSVAYPFFIATPDTIVPRAFKTQNMGIETIFIIRGPTKGIAATKTPIPTKISVKMLTANAAKTIIFLSMPVSPV